MGIIISPPSVLTGTCLQIHLRGAESLVIVILARVAVGACSSDRPIDIDTDDDKWVCVLRGLFVETTTLETCFRGLDAPMDGHWRALSIPSRARLLQMIER